MPSDQDRKIEELLRAYAKRRAADAGAAGQLEPVTRRILQAEVARLGQKQRPRSPGWAGYLSLFWPRMGFAFSMLVLLGAGVWVWVNLANPQRPLGDLAKAERTISQTDKQAPPREFSTELAKADEAKLALRETTAPRIDKAEGKPEITRGLATQPDSMQMAGRTDSKLAEELDRTAPPKPASPAPVVAQTPSRARPSAPARQKDAFGGRALARTRSIEPTAPAASKTLGDAGTKDLDTGAIVADSNLALVQARRSLSEPGMSRETRTMQKSFVEARTSGAVNGVLTDGIAGANQPPRPMTAPGQTIAAAGIQARDDLLLTNRQAPDSMLAFGKAESTGAYRLTRPPGVGRDGPGQERSADAYSQPTGMVGREMLLSAARPSAAKDAAKYESPGELVQRDSPDTGQRWGRSAAPVQIASTPPPAASVGVAFGTARPPATTEVERLQSYYAALPVARYSYQRITPTAADARGQPTGDAGLLKAFHVDVSGDLIRLTDADGSVYEGQVLAKEDSVARKGLGESPESPGRPTAGLKANQETEASESLQRGELESPAVLDFRATGTNLSLRQFVVVRGRLMTGVASEQTGVATGTVDVTPFAAPPAVPVATTVPVLTPADRRAATIAKPAASAISNAAPTSATTVFLRFNGKATFNGTNEVAIEALRVRR